MNFKDIESRLAWLGAVVVLIGVSAAAGSAFGAEPVSDRGAVTSTEPLAAAVAGARAANEEAAAEAAAAIARDTMLGLDIEIAGRTSTLTASAD